LPLVIGTSQRKPIFGPDHEGSQVRLPSFSPWDVKLQAFRVEAESVSLMIGDSSANIALSTTLHVQ